jgi:hypothetical protein
MAATEIRDRRRILRYRNLVQRQAVQMKNRVSGLLMETGVTYDKLRLHRMTPHDGTRKTRGQDGFATSFPVGTCTPTTCRFSPAHSE